VDPGSLCQKNLGEIESSLRIDYCADAGLGEFFIEYIFQVPWTLSPVTHGLARRIRESSVPGNVFAGCAKMEGTSGA